MSRVTDKPERAPVLPTDVTYLAGSGRDFKSPLQDILDDLGVVTLDSTGKIPLSDLPDSIVEGSSGDGGGDVLGPAGSIDGRPALFDGTSGKGLKQGAAGQLVPSGGTAGQPLVKASGTNFDVAWGNAIGDVTGPASAVVGRVALFGSTSGKALIAGAAGLLIPPGGTTGQVLAKSSNTDYAVGWVAAASGGGSGDLVGPASSVDGQPMLFNGITGKLAKAGNAGQLVPAGGTAAQALVKSSGVDYAAGWASVGDVTGPASVTADLPAVFNGTTGKIIKAGVAGQFVPPGGTDGQALVKTGADDYAVAWEDVEGTGGASTWDDLAETGGDPSAAQAALGIDDIIADLDGKEPYNGRREDASETPTLGLTSFKQLNLYTYDALGNTVTLTIPADVDFPDDFVWYGEAVSDMLVVGASGVSVVLAGSDPSEAPPAFIPAGQPFWGRKDGTDNFKVYTGGGSASGAVFDASVDLDADVGKILALADDGQIAISPASAIPFEAPSKAIAVTGATGSYYIDPALFAAMYAPIDKGDITAVDVLDCSGSFAFYATVSASQEFTGASSVLNGLSYTWTITATGDATITFSNAFQVSNNITDGEIILLDGEMAQISVQRVIAGAVNYLRVNAQQYLPPDDIAPAFSGALGIYPPVGVSGGTYEVMDDGRIGSPTPTITISGWSINGEAIADTSLSRVQTVQGRLRALTVTATNGVGSPAVHPTPLVASVGPVQPTHVGHATCIKDSVSGQTYVDIDLADVSGIAEGDDALLIQIWQTGTSTGEEFPSGFTKLGSTVAHTGAAYPSVYRIILSTATITAAQITAGLIPVKMANAAAAMLIVARGVDNWNHDAATVTRAASNTVAFTQRDAPYPSIAYQIVGGARANDNIIDIAASSGWSTPAATDAFSAITTSLGINFSWREVPDGTSPTGSNVGDYAGGGSGPHSTSLVVFARGPL